MSLAEFIPLALSSLFVIIDPVALIPMFLAMTPNDSPAQRARTARMACAVAAGVLITFDLVGQWIFKYLGITLPAFQMAGSVVLLLIALDMLRARRSPVQETREETDEGTAKADIAITPLGIPMLAGPGAITTTLLLHGKADGLAQQFFSDKAAIVSTHGGHIIFDPGWLIQWAPVSAPMFWSAGTRGRRRPSRRYI